MQEFNTKKLNPRNKTKIKLYNFPEELNKLLLKAARQAFEAEDKSLEGEVSLILISDKEIKKLNAKYRKVNRITDVISFLVPPDGDIYISEGRSKKQAAQQKHSWEKELAYLVIHGVLHLLGYTDYTTKARAKMFSKQDKIWDNLFKRV